MLKNSLIRQPTEEDPDEGIKDLVEITLKKMVGGWMLLVCGFKCLYLDFTSACSMFSTSPHQTSKQVTHFSVSEGNE